MCQAAPTRLGVVPMPPLAQVSQVQVTGGAANQAFLPTQGPWFAISTDVVLGTEEEPLTARVQLPVDVAPGTISLLSPGVTITGRLRADPSPQVSRPLHVVSGTITVESSTNWELKVTFAMVLKTDDGQQLSLAEGRVSLGCSSIPICPS